MTIQPSKFVAGRYFSQAEFNSATSIGIIIGYRMPKIVWHARAVGKTTDGPRQNTIVGPLKKSTL
jgi:hypothetical protein